MKKTIAILMSLILIIGMQTNVTAAESTIRINEINSSPDDWVEIINIGSEKVELSGYPLERIEEAYEVFERRKEHVIKVAISQRTSGPVR